MGIQFPPAYCCYCFPFPTVLLYIYCFFFVRISRMHVATLHTSLHTRHRCENEATYGKLDERSRPGSAVVCAVKLECGAIGE